MQGGAFRSRQGQRPLHRVGQRERAAPEQAVLPVAAEAPVADAVRGHRHAARRHRLQRRQVEPLLRPRQHHGDLRVREPLEEQAPLREPVLDQVRDAAGAQFRRQRVAEFRRLAREHRHRRRPRADAPAGLEVGRSGDRQHGAVRVRTHRLGHLPAHADAHRAPRQVAAQLGVRMPVAHVLEEVDARVRQVREAAGVQIAPVGAGEEQDVVRPGVPVAGGRSRPQRLPLAGQRRRARRTGEGHADVEARGASVRHVVRVLQLPAAEPDVVAVEPHGARRAHGVAPIAAAAASRSAAA